MNIKTNSVIGSNGNKSVSLPNGFYVGSLSAQGNLNITGITTSEVLNTNGLNASIVNVSSISGNGSGLTGVPNLQSGRVIALKYIFADPPMRA